MSENKDIVFKDLADSNGEFKRKVSSFRDQIEDDPDAKFPAEVNRYHLYWSPGCPWANRAAIVRTLKGLEDVISISKVDWLLTKENSWRFGYNGDKDPNNNFDFLKQVYFLSEPEYEGRFTVPVLFDKKTNKIVNNESSEIIRILNSAFNRFARNPTLDLYPEDKREAIDQVNEWVYEKFNNGVYKAGFATKQEAYEEAYDGVFEAMDRMEEILSKQNYLAGDTFTEADVRAFSTLVRFDVAYFGIFKVNRQQLVTFKNLWAYTKELYQLPEFKKNVYFDHIKNGYYSSMLHINPTGVVPKGPNVDFDEPHGRERK